MLGNPHGKVNERRRSNGEGKRENKRDRERKQWKTRKENWNEGEQEEKGICSRFVLSVLLCFASVSFFCSSPFHPQFIHFPFSPTFLSCFLTYFLTSSLTSYPFICFRDSFGERFRLFLLLLVWSILWIVTVTVFLEDQLICDNQPMNQLIDLHVSLRDSSGGDENTRRDGVRRRLRQRGTARQGIHDAGSHDDGVRSSVDPCKSMSVAVTFLKLALTHWRPS